MLMLPVNINITRKLNSTCKMFSQSYTLPLTDIHKSVSAFRIPKTNKNWKNRQKKTLKTFNLEFVN